MARAWLKAEAGEGEGAGAGEDAVLATRAFWGAPANGERTGAVGGMSAWPRPALEALRLRTCRLHTTR